MPNSFYYAFFYIFKTLRYPNKGALKIHMHNSHTTEPIYVCSFCGKGFHILNSLVAHESSHSKKEEPKLLEPQICNYCHKWFANKVTLTQHIKNMHEKSQSTYPCELCSHVSNTRKGITAHKAYKHAQERKFKCHMCDKTFRRAMELMVSNKF